MAKKRTRQEVETRFTSKDEMSRGTKSASSSLASFAKKFGPIAVGTAAATAATIAFVAITRKAVGVLRESITVTSDQAVQLKQLSAALGISTEAMQGFGFAGEKVGVSSENLGLAIQRMTRRIGEAAKGGGEAKSELEALGLPIQALAKLKPEEQFFAIADAMESVEGSSKRLASAFKFFDSEGAKPVLAILEDGTDALRDQFEEHRRLGGIMSGDLIDAGAAYKASQVGLKTAIAGVRNEIATEFLPVATRAVKAISDFVVENKDTIRQAAASLAENFGEALDVVGDFMDNHGDEFKAVLVEWAKIAGSATSLIIDISEGALKIGAFFLEANAKKLEIEADATGFWASPIGKLIAGPEKPLFSEGGFLDVNKLAGDLLLTVNGIERTIRRAFGITYDADLVAAQEAYFELEESVQNVGKAITMASSSTFDFASMMELEAERTAAAVDAHKANIERLIKIAEDNDIKPSFGPIDIDPNALSIPAPTQEPGMPPVDIEGAGEFAGMPTEEAMEISRANFGELTDLVLKLGEDGAAFALTVGKAIGNLGAQAKETFVDDVGKAVSQMGRSMSLALAQNITSLKGFKDAATQIWRDFTSQLISMLIRLIAKLAIAAALKAFLGLGNFSAVGNVARIIGSIGNITTGQQFGGIVGQGGPFGGFRNGRRRGGLDRQLTPTEPGEAIINKHAVNSIGRGMISGMNDGSTRAFLRAAFLEQEIRRQYNPRGGNSKQEGLNAINFALRSSAVARVEVRMKTMFGSREEGRTVAGSIADYMREMGLSADALGGI